jgi:ribosome maturation factor RimP
MASANRNFVNPGEGLWSYIETQALDENLRLYDVAKPRPNLLKIFVDKNKEEEGMRGSGVSVDDCVNLCRRLMHAFVVDGVALGVGAEPELEVSSPGLDRELRLEKHFNDAVGSNVKLWIEGGTISGSLESFQEGVLAIKEPEAKGASEPRGIVEFRIADVRKAQIEF